MIWYLCYGTRWTQSGLDDCLTWLFRTAQETQVPSCLRKVQIISAALRCLPLLCAVSRLVCEACIQADRMSCPPGPTALCRVYQSHPVGVPGAGLSKRCSFKHTSGNSFLTWCTCSISKSCCFLTSKWLNPFHIWKMIFLYWVDICGCAMGSLGY